jgi:pimeloyl-ACP methyl ester carboxylesterase/predicted Ser/Thr protein kinase
LDRIEWPIVKQVIVDALSSGVLERRRILDEALLDPALKLEIERLLKACVREMPHARLPAPDSDTAQPEAADRAYVLEPGQTIGPYSILRPIGRGGMGEVYLALDPRLQREVALKVLRRSASGRTLDEFSVVREARAAAQLNHPGIAAVYDVFHEAGRTFIVMEYVRGLALSDYLQAHRPAAAEAVGLATQIAEALAHAHRCGIIHCDLKPANVRLQPNGTVKILDFGLARTAGSTSGNRLDDGGPAASSLIGRIVGTPGYMAPEQLLGLAVTRAADGYSFGILLYELLAGQRPHQSNSNPFATLFVPAPPLPGVPAALRRLVERCLSPRVDERFASGVELLAAIRAVSSAAPTAETAAASAAAGTISGPPPQHHVITSDGVRIAYTVHGQGPYLIFVRGWVSHLDLMWEHPPFREYMETLGRAFTVVRYDARGNGLSQRDVRHIDLPTLLLDLEAIVDQLDPRSFILYGATFGGLIAVAYAARHPHRVQRLVLEGCYAQGRKVTSRARKLFLLNAFKVFPEAAFLILSYATNPSLEQSRTRRPESVQQMITPDTAGKFYSFGLRIDISREAAAVKAPTLLLHRQESHSIPIALGRELARLIPQSTFVALPGHEHNVWDGDAQAGVRELERFLTVTLT